MYFGDCTVGFDLSIRADGHAIADRVTIGGRSPCNDIRPCVPDALLRRRPYPGLGFPLTAALPWPGRLAPSSGNRFRGWIDACFDTCIGRYAGRLPVDLKRVGGEWALIARKAGVGDGVLQIDVQWEMAPGRLERGGGVR
jgi:hypothetical protein